MNSRDRDTKSLQDKFKEFFKKNPPGVTPAARNELVVSGELERELAAETPLNRRLRALRDVADKALHQRVQEGGVEKIWRCTRDLLEDSNAEARHAALAALRALAEGQADQLQVMRTIIFRYLRATHATAPPEDATLRFKLFHTLTNNGKNINCFEEEIGEFLLEWLPTVAAPAQLVEFLMLIINVIKFNATYLDEHIKHGIVRSACELCVYSTTDDVVNSCLSLLEAVMCYSLLPRSALPTFVAALCRTVNMADYCAHSWKLMRHVLGGDAGFAAMQELVQVARSGDGDAGLLRGAVFYINSALWSPRRPPALKVSPRAVLPALMKALEGNHAVVTYEVVNSLTACVTHARAELCEPAWDQVLRLLTRLLEQDKSFDPPNEMIHSKVHALISTLEQLDDAGHFGGEPDALLDLVDAAGHDRPEKSSMRLVTARAGALGACGGGWTGAALALAERYLRHEPRMPVRVHTLTQLMCFIQRNRYVFGSELVELVGVPVLSACALDADCGLRAAAARHATALQAAPTADAATDLVDLLEKILNRPFEMYLTDVPIPPDADTADIKLAVTGLIQLLHDKLLVSPAALPLRCFLVLLDHLAKHYNRPALFQHHPDIRLKIFEMLFGLRANSLNCVGFCYENGVMVSGQSSLRITPTCSPWLVAEPWQVRGQTAGSREASGAAAPGTTTGSCVVAARRVSLLLAEGLARESDWTVLGAVLRALPALLQARALALGRRAHDLDSLAATLCSMISDRSLNLPESLRVAGGGKLLVSEFHGAVLPALAALAPYHSYLEPSTQQRIVRCLLKYGMVLRSPQPYINALTIFTLETRDTMVKMLPEVLLDLSKITDTQAIASPMLEFLSTLTRLPKVFASFVEDQYMSVFAILLPYTNPSRYNHYVVSLAHHVIAAWFLKCRLSYRRNFVKFIIHGLHNYIIMPFEEQLHSRTNHFQQSANEDSSNRQRSSSLGSRAVHRSSGVRQNAGSSASAAFHVELTETCVDLLARYTATPCSAKPRRSDTARFLFQHGHAVTWLVGHKLVTVTTAGCHRNSLKHGLCDRCAVLCKQHADSLASPLPPLHAPAPPLIDTLLQEQPPQSQIQVQVNDTESEPSAPANAPEVKRQNSSENCKSDPLVEILNHFTQRFERISKEVDSEEATWWRAGGTGGAGGGACACWCAQWAELHVRTPTGDVCWLLRLQNQMDWDYLQECPLQEVAALLNPLHSPSPPPSPGRAPPPPPPDARHNVTADSSQRARAGSAAGRASGEMQDLHKSSSDSVVASEKKNAQAAANSQLRMSTQPINIPGSPQRQSSDNSDSNDDLMLILPEGKSRHPVRRSNSSPEMSSSWKIAAAPEASLEMIHLPSCEPTNPAAASSAPHSKKPSKKSDMRVSCEAIPEEMSGTSPLPAPHHPQLCTFNSDPGSAAPTAPPAPPAAARSSHNQLQKTASDGTVPERGTGRERDDLPPLARSKRSNTISVMSPTRRHRTALGSSHSSHSSHGSNSSGAAPSGVNAPGGGGVTPAFVFLQLYHNMSTYPMTPPVPGETQNILNPGAERPLKVSGIQHERTIKNLDLLPPVETYKVGVLYVGPGQQDNEVAILRNEYGSVRYADFLRQLGSLVPLGAGGAGGGGGGALGAEQLFLNLETGGKDGTYTYVWHDDIMQVQFHVATAMPNSESDPSCNEKRKYIGNDFVSIVYNDSGNDFHIHTIKGQLNFCIVIVEPLEHGMTCVRLKSKDERILREFLPHVGACCVSDHNAPLLARQLALHAALASLIAQSLSLGGLPYASNSLERLRAIKRLRRRLEAERCAAAARQDAPYADRARPAAMTDFNDYT